MLRLRELYPKLDMGESTIREFLRPPASPQEWIFAATTRGHLRRSEDACHTVPVWWQSRLLAMWLRGIYGHGRSWALQAVGAGKSRKHLQNFMRDWTQVTVSVVA